MSLWRDIAYGVGAIASAPVWGWSLLRTGKWRTDWAGRFGKAPRLPGPRAAGKRPRLLLHAVSVGEVNALRQLVAHFQCRAPDVELVIAATTNTGYARALELFGGGEAKAKEKGGAEGGGGPGAGPEGESGGESGGGGVVAVVRYPLDFSFAVGRFLDAAGPDAVGLVELEVWPNFVEACDRRGIPVAVINGRLSARSFRGYRKLRPLLRSTFARLAVCGVQTSAYAQRFMAMGARDVRVMDTMKWDTAHLGDEVEGSDELAKAMGVDRGKPVIVAGSTGPGEEAMLAAGKPEGVQLVLAPRKPERFQAVAAELSQGAGIARRSAPGASDPRAGLFLLDTMGELRRAYAFADVAIVGRSFLGLYGSDVMEPAALGKPVIVGPHHGDFQDTVEAMREAGGIVVTDDPMAQARELLNDRDRARRIARAGRGVIRSRRGATARYAQLLMSLLPATARPGRPDANGNANAPAPARD